MDDLLESTVPQQSRMERCARACDRRTAGRPPLLRISYKFRFAMVFDFKRWWLHMGRNRSAALRRRQARHAPSAVTLPHLRRWPRPFLYVHPQPRRPFRPMGPEGHGAPPPSRLSCTRCFHARRPSAVDLRRP